MPLSPSSFRPARALASVLVCVLIVGCASSGGRAPVEDRPAAGRTLPTGGSSPSGTPSAGAQASGGAPKAVTANAEHAGKPGYYTVRPGDTLARIALEHGQNWRDLARWNGMENPNVIEVGQVLRVVPAANDVAATAQPVAAASRVETRPLDARAGEAGAGPAATPPPASAASAAPKEADADIVWMWPASGPVLATFDEARNVKGVAIGGKAGDSVLAAADGRVVYAGSGVRGYGNLLIVKHNATYLTAYAHNQALIVKEDQIVRRGQKIAEMGSSDAERVQLHFEIRRMGKPVDPARMLPAR